MIIIIKMGVLALLFTACGQNIKASHAGGSNLSEENVAATSDSISNAKKMKVKKCLINASSGLHNVIVDHAKEASLIIGRSPKSNEEVLFQPDNPAPEEYIEFFQKKLFTHNTWNKLETRLRKAYHKEVYESMMASQKRLFPDLAKGENKEQIIKYFDEFAYKIVDRFYIPNYKAIFINNLYYEWEFKGGKPVRIDEYIKKKDLPLVIEVLEEY